MTTTSRRAGFAGLLIAALVALGAPGGASAERHRHGRTAAEPGRSLPIVIGHRGASAYRPEHTLASYALAIEMGADYIEPDLVSTKDHVLVARHENDITGTTDVASHEEFAYRRTTKVIDGQTITGWFSEDFTLAELKTLRAVERLPDVRPANTAFNGRFEIPTFQEVIDLARREGVGIYPETKHPTYFDSIGLSLEEPLLEALRSNGLDRRNAKVFIQSFEVGNLRELDRTTRVPLVQLIDERGAPADLVAAGDPRTYDDLVTPAGLKAIARYADGIGPAKSRIVPLDATRHIMAPTTLLRDAHREGLLVHPFTFRPENTFLAADFQLGDPASPEFPRARGDQPAELALFYRLGVDGVFADNADTAVAVRERTFRRAAG
ncbi:MAG: glycerophosphoryl diester phosphodiesterase [Solirubrobacteraceae bacterium]|jgi:glycerophosphoryl diester phosphodiesterase|nr:glycerophosphoryl diester phosphodiesterase [Solirubrobacteraceae bacterium]